MQNIRSGKSAATVQDALREFYGKDKATKQKVINKIFSTNLASAGKNVKPHPSLAQGTQGFGLQKFVKVQKGAQVIEQYRSQVSSQESAHKASLQRRESYTEA